MKRAAALLMVLVMMCGAALAIEITFMDFPWGASVRDVEKTMNKTCDYYDSQSDAILPYWSEYTTDPAAAYGSGTMYSSGWLGFGSFTAAMFPDSDAFEPYLVGGHSVRDIRMWFTYGVNDKSISKEDKDSELYMAQYSFSVMDTMSAYEDLKAKLDLLYGDGKETVDSGENSIWSTNDNGNVVQTDYTYTKKEAVWYGDNNTSVRLECSASSRPIEEDYWDHYLCLIYGKTDQDGKIHEIESIVKAEMLQNELSSYSADLSGL